MGRVRGVLQPIHGTLETDLESREYQRRNFSRETERGPIQASTCIREQGHERFTNVNLFQRKKASRV